MRSECSVGTSVTSATPLHFSLALVCCEQTQNKRAKEKKRGGETESNTERETTDEWRAPVQASGRGSTFSGTNPMHARGSSAPVPVTASRARLLLQRKARNGKGG